MIEKTLPIHVSGHAIERVIQRSRLITLPIGRQDILAIHAEFADALPLACIAHDAVRQSIAAGSLADAGRLTILLPSANGVFLCRWCEESGRLLIKTFIGRNQLNQAEIAAIDELKRFSEAQVAAHLLDGLAPGWLGLETRDLHAALVTAWRHFGWRLDEEVRLPGMSDAAWSSREPRGNPSTLGRE